MGIRELGGVLLLAYVCSGSVRSTQEFYFQRQEKIIEVGSSNVSKTYLYPIIDDNWSVFENDAEIVDSMKSVVEKTADAVWDKTKSIYLEFNAEKPAIIFECEKPDKNYRNLAYWKGDTITIMTGKKDSTHLLRDMYAAQKMTYADFLKTMEKVLVHEMGHHLFANMANENGTGELWWAPQNLNYYDNVAYNLISEGIPEYIRKDVLANNAKSIDLKMFELFPVYVQAIDVYEGGYALVKPILDKYGFEGIDYLSRHPPTVDDLDRLVSYQKKCMNNLELKMVAAQIKNIFSLNAQ